MSLNKPATGDTIVATDVSDIVNHLEGASGTSLAWFFRVLASNDFVIRLPEAAGAQVLSIQDSAGTEVASIDSDGVITATNTSFTALTVPVSAAPAQTTSGSLVYDSAKLALTVGNGSGRDIISSGVDLGTLWAQE